MIPETWLPTATDVTAETDPVAVTVCVTSPRSTFAVRYFGSDFFRLPSSRKTPAPIPTATATQMNFFIRLSKRFSRLVLFPGSRRECSGSRRDEPRTSMDYAKAVPPAGPTVRMTASRCARPVRRRNVRARP